MPVRLWPNERIHQHAHQHEAERTAPPAHRGTASGSTARRSRTGRGSAERQARHAVEAAGPAAPMFAACSSSAMVHSVSMSSVRPCVRSSTRPLARPIAPATSAAASRPRQRLVPAPVHGQHADGIGAGAEERGMAERDDAGVAEHQVERQREQDRDQHLRAEREVVREQRRTPRSPRSRAAPPTTGSGGAGASSAGGVRERAHAPRLPNRPCGRHSSSDQGERVDEHRAALGEVDLEHEVEHADQQRGEEHAGRPRPARRPRPRSGSRRGSAAGTAGSRPRISAPRPPPTAARPLPSAKVSVNRRPTSTPSDCAMRRLSTAARIRAPKRVRSKPSHSAIISTRAGGDQRQAVGAVADEAEVGLAAQPVGQHHASASPGRRPASPRRSSRTPGRS